MTYCAFKLKYPVKLKYVRKLKWGKSPCMGIYEWDSGKQIHVIKVDSDIRGDDHMNTIMHEYIHAWQCEMGLKLNHGRVFKWWAEYLKDNGYIIAKYQ